MRKAIGFIILATALVLTGYFVGTNFSSVQPERIVLNENPTSNPNRPSEAGFHGLQISEYFVSLYNLY